ncbi:MAG TPA: NAD-dependent epimerase/dehydratase family protein [Gordonia sp. (in: high G+C Gram-positive bacteria)]|uniref:NAD-dependent epimerase/dehydratase family protein n=1 Tax=unclassified Gordonia (in: high G+C Gram-positive bacteria) TaxID=2657482 RepID=UPI000F900BB7|nr:MULTISPECIES: NAD-dependent epimerase/dehydratase family protein [unclassified Gordonia (in: high G+C Gram-positive bacteria)]RUP39593.1 MAG: NAD-dependent epimerase/dehydratase family protein [Gordonia sp. (in: high G+C Gram-positive bacteria)]HNP57026.1 NAD-dependent epimerase/dehydratase family protein [Gordonia sp. (in: high G+C Gram-positive bacteria)]HRC50989.1 NAD-dependent epimerase/dehydratase family protein [Gordonia sp. (in: high G+C Gram-positive bacteria)]
MVQDTGSGPTPPRVVLVTGASTFLGGYLVARLAANPDIEKVLAVDSRVPSKALLRRMGRAEFLRLDIRRPTIAKTIAAHNVDTVVHAATSVMDLSPHSAAIKEFNVVGAMQVCAACQRSPSVKRLVLRSTAMVYGASGKDPAFFSEGDHAVREPSNGYGRDLLDIEGYARGLARRRPDIDVTIARYQAILGPRIQTRMGAYLSAPIVPSVIGYQPRLQFLHEEDALGALEHITLSAPSGTFNIAADGVITLTQAIRRAGRIELPVPSGLVTPITGVFADVRSARLRSSQMDYLTYGRVLDNTRMRTRLGFEPRFTTSETLEDFIERGASDMVVSPNRWRELEQRIVSTAHQLL